MRAERAAFELERAAFNVGRSNWPESDLVEARANMKSALGDAERAIQQCAEALEAVLASWGGYPFAGMADAREALSVARAAIKRAEA
jgi:outer membrane protein TolC